MTVNDKSDIISDILRSFHNNTTARHQESHELNELATQHPRKGCQPSQNVQTCHPAKKCQNWWLGRKERKLLTSKPATDTVLVLSNQCILYVIRRDKSSL